MCRVMRGASPGTLTLGLLALAACSSSGDGDDAGSGGGAGAGGGSAAGVFVQGHVLSRSAAPGAEETFSAFLSMKHYDRCDPKAQGDPAAEFITFSAPASVGTHSGAWVGSDFSAGAAEIQVASIDELAVEGSISADAEHSGGFALDTCGLFGQSLAVLEPCTLDDAAFPTAAAISPAGRVALADFDNRVRVFKRSSSGADCSYELDASFGQGGVLTWGAVTRKLAFDAQDRLYAATDGGAFQASTPGSLVRVNADGSIQSCLYESQLSASVTDSAPADLAVLRDGSVAYAGWALVPERKLDLGSPAFGAGNVQCAFEYGTDDELRYANALSVHDDGFLFRRWIGSFDGPIHAEVTALDLTPLLRFGGTTSGRGIEGLVDVEAGARCPVGYCMASPTGMAMYGSDGGFRQYALWADALEGAYPDAVLDATEGSASDAFVLLETGQSKIGVRVREP